MTGEGVAGQPLSYRLAGSVLVISSVENERRDKIDKRMVRKVYICTCLLLLLLLLLP